ncbi:MAG: alpha/beta fold hydrolase [Dehalococcoidia bacterium]
MERVRLPSFFALTVLAAILVAACGGGLAELQDVELSTADGVTIVGDVRRGDSSQGGTWVLLAHQWPNERRLWEPIADGFQERGYSVLAWDFRCHGESECRSESKSDSVQDNWRDWNAAIDFAVAEGATAIYAIGASMGGTSAIQVAAERDEIVAVAAISSPNRFKGLDALERFDQVTIPKLFIAGAGDMAAPKFSQRFDARAVGPSRLVVLDTDLHGNTLAVDEEFGPRVQALLYDFVVDPLAVVAAEGEDRCDESFEAGIAGEIIAHGLRREDPLPEGILARLAELNIDVEDLEEVEVREREVVLASRDLLENRPTILEYSITFVLVQPGGGTTANWTDIEGSAVVVGACGAS